MAKDKFSIVIKYSYGKIKSLEKVNDKNMNYYFEVFKKYAVFNGRARRKEYWMFFLFNLIVSFIIGILDGMSGNSGAGQMSAGMVYSLATIVPSIAVGVRRMHDVNKSGWFLIVPFYNIILAFTPGTKGDNQYGSDPKAI